MSLVVKGVVTTTEVFNKNVQRVVLGTITV